MKYKRLLRIAPKRAERFLSKYKKTFERDFKNRSKQDQNLKTKYLKIKKSHEQKRYGHKLIEWIDTFQLSLGLLFSFVYQDHIEELVVGTSLLMELIPSEKDLKNQFIVPIILGKHGVTYE